MVFKRGISSVPFVSYKGKFMKIDSQVLSCLTIELRNLKCILDCQLMFIAGVQNKLIMEGLPFLFVISRSCCFICVFEFLPNVNFIFKQHFLVRELDLKTF